MEFDNDRIIKRTHGVEIFYWVLLVLINPFFNILIIFPGDARMWPVMLLVNIVVLPAYIFYSEFIVTKFLFEKRSIYFPVLTVLFFILMQLFLFSFYLLILKFDLSPYERTYFSYNYSTLLRESLWTIVNTSLALAIGFIKKALDDKEVVLNLQKDNTSFKLKYLRSQLNPHFLFNTLNSIYSLSLQKSDKTPEVVVKLADLMRYLLYECNEEKVPLNKEIEFIRNYIEIEKIRYKADVRFTVEGETDSILIEPFLFISFIENGFKHALDNSFSEPFIFITLKAEQKQIILNVINNTNIDLETQAKRLSGTGMTNSKSLLELLYPDSYELDIIQTELEEKRKSELRMKHARDRLETLYPDSHTLDVILSNNSFAVSLIIKPRLVD